MNAVKVFLIVLAILLFPGITSAQVLSITYQTIPETPIPGDVFALQINIVNSGHAVKDVKLSVSEREDDLSIISDGEKLSYLTINVGDIAGSVSTAVKLKAEKEGTFQLRIKLSYDYGAGSFEEVIPIIVMDRPSLNVESVSHPVIEPDSTGKWVFDVVNSGGEAKNVKIQLVAPDGFVAQTSRMSFDS